MAAPSPADRHLKSIRLPSHASPSLFPLQSPQSHPDADFNLHDESASITSPDHGLHSSRPPPTSLISPAFTPPQTPGTQTPNLNREPRSVQVDTTTSDLPAPELLEHLPHVECVVRARIPTTTGQEMWLHLYQNDHDSKEHLAIVFGPRIRSSSLDAERPGETEKDRMIRGAYTGRLHPGRVHSRVEELRQEAGTMSAQGGSLSSIIEAGRETVGTAGEQVQERTDTEKAPLVRIHSECYTGETVWSARCDCGEQLDEAARLMSLPQNAEVGGVIIYLRQEGRGIGLGEKLKAYNLQDLGHDTYEANLMLRHPADARSYGLATAMLVDLDLGGDRGIRLLTNNPEKVRAIEGPQREIVVRERVAMVPLAWKTGGKQGVRSEEVEKYLSTKIEKFKHMIG